VTVAERMTIDALAQRAGTKTSTVRLYQTRGLLPPPEIRGRVGYYSSGHLARLRVIERLQQRGYSLAAIKELLENWAKGVSLSTVLDPDRELATLGEPAELSLAEFAALFADGDIDLETVRRAGHLGLVTFDEERGVVQVPSQAFLEIGRELAAYRIPAARSVQEFEHLAADARRIARRFMALFAEYVVGSTELTPEKIAELQASSDRFRAMAATAVVELVSNAIDQLTAEAAAALSATSDESTEPGQASKPRP
jgi:DNA-binding transcriptional MerR regulator